MSVLLDALLAFFSCVGIWTLAKMLIGRFFTDVSGAFDDRNLKEDSSAWMKPKNTIK